LLGTEHLEVALALSNLAALAMAQGEASQASMLLARALAVREKQLGVDHPDVAKTLVDYAAALRKIGRSAEADALETRADEIRAKAKS